MRSPDEEPRPQGRLRSLFRWLIDPGNTLGNRTLNAGIWAGALSFSTRLLRFLRTIVLARLLAPNDFGLMGIAVLALSLLQTFTKTGFNSALIQREGDIDGHLNTAWTVGVIRGAALGLALFSAAPLVGRFFGSSEAVPLVRALALAPLVQGLGNVGVVYFDKELLFRERFLFRSVPNMADLAISIVLAIWLRNAWALVLGLLASHVVGTVASYVVHPHRPKFEIVGRRLRELLGFGIWVSVNGIVVYLMLNLDDIFVGRLLTPEDLGLYQMAFTITTMIVLEITNVVNQVAFPAFSKLQSNRGALRRAFVETLQLVAFVALPVAAGFWFVGPTAVEYLLGDKWLGLLPAYGPLIIWGVARSVAGASGPLFGSIGKPSMNTVVYTATTVVLALLIIPFTQSWGIAGAAWATVVAAGVLVLHLALVERELKIGWWQLVRPIVIAAVCAGVMLLALEGVAAVVSNPNSPWLLVWGPTVGVTVYATATLVAHRFIGYEPLRFITRSDRTA